MVAISTFILTLLVGCTPAVGEKQPVEGQESGTGTSSQGNETTTADTTGLASADNSTIVGTTPINANGVGASTITITLKNSSNEPVVGVTPVYSTYEVLGVIDQNCTETDAEGVSICTNSLRSSQTGWSKLRIVSPISKNGSAVKFVTPVASPLTSSIVGTGPIPADDATTSSLAITLLDSDNEPIVGETPTFSVSGTGTNTIAQTCTPTSSTGESVCAGALRSDTPGLKTLSLVTPIAMTGSDVSFTSTNAADVTNSSIVGTGNIVADGVSSSDITITLLDSGMSPVVGYTPTFTVSGTGNSLSQSCSVTDGSGVSTCTAAFTTTVAEIKTLSIATPIAKSDGTVEAVAPYLDTNRGYQQRPCGLDMNRNGVMGESADCNVCDGVTTDVDGDGQNEDLFYVDSASGSDGVACGTTGSPCQTVNYVIASRLDGPSTGQEDIICVKGTFNDVMVLGAGQGGKTGNYVRDGQEYPNNPFMIVGWDYDNDGEYPPFDQDDTAVFTGGSGYWLDISSGADFVEFAHLSVNSYSHGSRGGIIDAAFSEVTHLYFHDIESQDVNKGDVYGNNSLIFYADRGENWSIENSRFLDMGSVFFASSDLTLLAINSFKMRGLTIQLFGQNADDIYGVIELGGVNGAQLANNVFNANVNGGTYDPNQVQMINMYGCTRNVTIRDNDFLDTETGVNVYISSTCASAQVMDGIVVDRNYFRFSDDAVMPGFAAFLIQDIQGDPLYTLSGIKITNNVVDAVSEPTEYGVLYNVSVSSGSVPGTVIAAGNTFSGTFNTSVFFAMNLFSTPADDFNVTGNIFDSIVTGTNIDFDFVPGTLVSDYNAFSGTKTFYMDPSSLGDITAWEANSTATNSQDCAPTFVNKAGGNFALHSSDTCAKDAGTDLSGLATELIVDHIGATRDTGTGADIGAFKN